MTKPPERYWRTRELYLAAYLFARGATIVGIQPGEDDVVFAFIDSYDRQRWFDEFRSGRPLIDARTFALSIRILQRHAADSLLEFHGE